MIGDVVKLKSGDYYVKVNEQGTLERLPKPRWQLVLLFWLRCIFKKPKNKQETIDFLYRR